MKFRRFFAADGRDMRCGAGREALADRHQDEFGVVHGIHHRGTVYRCEGHRMSQCVPGRLHPS